MAEPEDMVVPLLREMRAEMNTRFDRVDARLDAVEKAQNTFSVLEHRVRDWRRPSE